MTDKIVTSPEAVQRFVATDLDPVMQPDKIGAWVHYDDYAALSARVAELETDKLAIAQKFDELHPDPALMARIIMTSIERENENIGLRECAKAAEQRAATLEAKLDKAEGGFHQIAASDYSSVSNAKDMARATLAEITETKENDT